MSEPRSYRDRLVAAALEVEGVRIADEQAATGVTFVADRPLSRTVPDLTARFESLSWRIEEPRGLTRFVVLNEIDMQMTVHIETARHN